MVRNSRNSKTCFKCPSTGLPRPLKGCRMRRIQVSTIKELSHTGDGRGLLRCHVSRPADEAAHPLRKVDDYLAALLRHSAVPVLCVGRWNPKNSLPRHLQSAGDATPEPTVGVAAW